MSCEDAKAIVSEGRAAAKDLRAAMRKVAEAQYDAFTAGFEGLATIACGDMATAADLLRERDRLAAEFSARQAELHAASAAMETADRKRQDYLEHAAKKMAYKMVGRR